MKRRVIQVANSTQLISLPREWAKRNNIKKGQELDILEDGDRVVVTTTSNPPLEKANIDISKMSAMTHRVLGSYYRAGVDTLKVSFNDPKLIEKVYDSLSRETMIGFEVLEQGNNHCLLQHVAGETEEFDKVLKRIFLLLVNMSSECLRMLKENKFDMISNLSFLERQNNKLTTTCRRTLNKTPSLSKSGKTGPSYFIIECIENLADEYKYMAQHYSKLAGKTHAFDKDAMKTFESANSMMKLFFEYYYQFDMDKLIKIKNIRDKVIVDAHKAFNKNASYIDVWLTHHAIMLATLVFNMAGPSIIVLSRENGLIEQAHE